MEPWKESLILPKHILICHSVLNGYELGLAHFSICIRDSRVGKELILVAFLPFSQEVAVGVLLTFTMLQRDRKCEWSMLK